MDGEKTQPTYFIGVDIGQKVDHSAVCVVEEVEGRYVVRFIWKFPLGTAYPKLVDMITGLYKSVVQKGVVMAFTVDATGSGQAPAQMLQDALPDVRVDPFVFTNQKKRELVGRVKVMHSFGRLKFARRKGDETYNTMLDQLIYEMKSVQAKVIREDATDPEIEVFSTGRHDDMFTALALAVYPIRWEAPTGADAIQFLTDHSWVRTPLSQPNAPEQIAWFVGPTSSNSQPEPIID